MDNLPHNELLLGGHAHHRAGRLEEAESFYRQAVEREEMTVDARLRLGMVLHELGRLVEATDVLGRLVVDHPGSAAGWVQLARAIIPQGFAWEAHAAISKALKAKPDSDTLVVVSVLQMSLQDIAGAESACRRATKMTPKNVSAWIQLGQILTAKGQKVEAAAAYRNALTSEPGNDMARFFLAALGAADGASTGIEDRTDTGAPRDYVRLLFDGVAEQFDSLLVGSLKYRVPQLLDAMLSNWLADNRLDPLKPMAMLDAGCGTGLCGIWMAEYRGSLIGVDLSRRMLRESQARGIYDELIPAEVVEELERRTDELNLIVAADVLVYLGDLQRLFAAAATALRVGGILIFSVETTPEADFQLLPTLRYAHSTDYLHRLASSNRLAVRATKNVVLRLEQGADVHGYLMLAEKVP